MKFVATPIQGVTVVEGVAHFDQRGSFRRLWGKREFERGGLPTAFVESSLSETKRLATLRGMHFQLPPCREDKLVQCLGGRIYDVALDLRPRSRSFLGHFGVELAGGEPRALFIPAGCAHGFLTLTDDCAVMYTMTDFYDQTLARGVRWNDPQFRIAWPNQPSEILPRDAEYADFDSALVKDFAAY